MRRHTSTAAGLLACLAIAASPRASADAPSGSYQIAFSGAQQVWGPIATSFSPNLPLLGGDAVAQLALGATIDAAGHVDGSVAETLGGSLTGTLLGPPVSGTVTGGDAYATGLKLKYRAAGLTNQPLDPSSLDAVVRGNALLTADQGFLVGTIAQKTCFDRVSYTPVHQCESVSIDASAPVELIDWTLTLNVMTDAKNRLSGSASAMLDDGTIYDFDVKGKYSVKNDTSTLTLKPANDDSKGASISIKGFQVSGSTILAGQLRFRMRGIKSDVDL